MAHYRLLLTLLSLLAIALVPAHGTPANTSPLSPSVLSANMTARDDDPPMAWHCELDKTTYVDQGSDGSPWQSDCLMLIKDIADHTDHWTFGDCHHTELVSWHTCHFGIEKGDDDTWCFPVRKYEIGNGDITDYIRGSIQRFNRSDGRVGSYGVVKCPGITPYVDKWVSFKWGIY